VLAAAAVCVAAGVAVVLSRSEAREAGSSYSAPNILVGTLSSGVRTACQPGETVPGGSARLQLTIDSHGRATPALSVVVRAQGRMLTAGSAPSGPPAGRVNIPLRRVATTRAGATVCVTAAGRQPVGLVGLGGLADPARLGGHAALGRLALIYWRGGRETGWTIVPAVWHRFGLGKATWEGPWTMALAIALVLLAAGAAAFALIRGAR
jgi:hypothetical protein